MQRLKEKKQTVNLPDKNSKLFLFKNPSNNKNDKNGINNNSHDKTNNNNKNNNNTRKPTTTNTQLPVTLYNNRRVVN